MAKERPVRAQFDDFSTRCCRWLPIGCRMSMVAQGWSHTQSENNKMCARKHRRNYLIYCYLFTLCAQFMRAYCARCANSGVFIFNAFLSGTATVVALCMHNENGNYDELCKRRQIYEMKLSAPRSVHHRENSQNGKVNTLWQCMTYGVGSSKWKKIAEATHQSWNSCIGARFGQFPANFFPFTKIRSQQFSGREIAPAQPQ